GDGAVPEQQDRDGRGQVEEQCQADVVIAHGWPRAASAPRRFGVRAALPPLLWPPARRKQEAPRPNAYPHESRFSCPPQKRRQSRTHSKALRAEGARAPLHYLHEFRSARVSSPRRGGPVRSFVRPRRSRLGTASAADERLSAEYRDAAGFADRLSDAERAVLRAQPLDSADAGPEDVATGRRRRRALSTDAHPRRS